MSTTQNSFRPALVLNADFMPLSHYPLSTWGWQDAVRAVVAERVAVVESYPDLVRAANFSMQAPAVIALREYQRPQRYVSFTRSNLLLRDGCCVYCGAQDDLTMDHVRPRSGGHRHSWQNSVIACSDCNNKKGAKTPAAAGLKLPYEPYAPTWRQLEANARSRLRKDLDAMWRPYIIAA